MSTLFYEARSWIVNTGRRWPEGGSREDAQTFDPETQPAATITGKTGGQWQISTGQQNRERRRRRAVQPRRRRTRPDPHRAR